MRVSRVAAIGAVVLALVLPPKMCLADELDASQLEELQLKALGGVVLCPVQVERGCSVIKPAQPEHCPRQFCNVVARTVNKKKICMWNCQPKHEAPPDLGNLLDELLGKDAR